MPPPIKTPETEFPLCALCIRSRLQELAPAEPGGANICRNFCDHIQAFAEPHILRCGGFVPRHPTDRGTMG